MKNLVAFLAFFSVLSSSFKIAVQSPSLASPAAISTVFQAGEDGYRCFRIPAIVRSPQGVLLAFAEGRRNNCGDFGDVDIVLKTSVDGGNSWSRLQVAASFGDLQCGNPAPVFDLLDPAYPAGRLLLFYNTGNASEQDLRLGKGLREVWFVASEDSGETWQPPVNITAQVHKPGLAQGDWRSYANTPGHALQLATGRIFVPANHSAGAPQEAFRDYRAHAFFSDDHAKTFRLSSDVKYPGSNESTAAALPGGGVLMSIRNQSGDRRNRLLARSDSGGEVWDSVWFAADLPDPVCQGSLLNVKLKNGETTLLHSNAAHSQERCCLTVKISADEGLSWQTLHEIYPGSAAYSDLVWLREQATGVLFEADDYGRICFARFGF